jgi:hypothetical protein
MARDPKRDGQVLNCQQFIERLREFSTLHALKLYRLQLEAPLRVPTLPCLDHEAVLHGGVSPHVAAYVEDASGSLHEVVFIPDERKVYLDVVSTVGECTEDRRDWALSELKARFPAYAVRVVGPSWLRGDRRVAKACRAQVTLRDVLTGDHLDRTRTAVDRLQTIGTLMEKESRVASWGARTVMTPVLAVGGFLTYQTVGRFVPQVGENGVTVLRYATVGVLGGFFLYYGLKAVHLTEMANRVWKRSAEYGLILSERRRLNGKP